MIFVGRNVVEVPSKVHNRNRNHNHALLQFILGMFD